MSELYRSELQFFRLKSRQLKTPPIDTATLTEVPTSNENGNGNFSHEGEGCDRKFLIPGPKFRVLDAVPALSKLQLTLEREEEADLPYSYGEALGFVVESLPQDRKALVESFADEGPKNLAPAPKDDHMRTRIAEQARRYVKHEAQKCLSDAEIIWGKTHRLAILLARNSS